VAQEDFAQIKLHFVDSMQHDYEVIRPLVLFSETAAAHSLETGVERTVVGDKAKRFIIDGMLGLADHRPGAAGRKGHVYPDAVAAYILYLKPMPRSTYVRSYALWHGSLATKRITTPSSGFTSGMARRRN
jgi:hypothetical protein